MTVISDISGIQSFTFATSEGASSKEPVCKLANCPHFCYTDKNTAVCFCAEHHTYNGMLIVQSCRHRIRDFSREVFIYDFIHED